MKTIMLVCSAGMSTSLLVTKMQQAAKEQNIEVNIFAISAAESDQKLNDQNIKIDALLLGPQVRFMKQSFEQKVKDKNIPVSVIDMKAYGLMDGKAVLKQTLDLIS